MADQLRMYTIKPGEMASWLEEWGRLVAPLRRRSGFEILGAWTTESDQFVWILRYEGPKTWEEADAAYYASPERTQMQPDPARHIAKSEHWLMSALDASRHRIARRRTGGAGRRLHWVGRERGGADRRRRRRRPAADLGGGARPGSHRRSLSDARPRASHTEGPL